MFLATGPGFVILLFEHELINKKLDFEYMVNIFGIQILEKDWYKVCFDLVIVTNIIELLSVIPLVIFNTGGRRYKLSKKNFEFFVEIDQFV